MWSSVLFRQLWNQFQSPTDIQYSFPNMGLLEFMFLCYQFKNYQHEAIRWTWSLLWRLIRPRRRDWQDLVACRVPLLKPIWPWSCRCHYEYHYRQMCSYLYHWPSRLSIFHRHNPRNDLWKLMTSNLQAIWLCLPIWLMKSRPVS